MQFLAKKIQITSRINIKFVRKTLQYIYQEIIYQKHGFLIKINLGDNRFIKGIYWYVFDKNESHLNLRQFKKEHKITVYKKMTEYVKRVKKKGAKRSNTTIKKRKAITSFREAKAAKQKLII